MILLSIKRNCKKFSNWTDKMSDPVNSVQYASFQISLIAEPVLPFWFTCVPTKPFPKSSPHLPNLTTI